MADITMCTNITCPLRESCYRFKANRNELWQSVAKFEWYVENGMFPKCQMYWKYDEK